MKYKEEQDGNKEKDFNLPVVWVRDLKTREITIIAGVHVSGCGSQYPKTGLETLAHSIGMLQKQSLGQCDIVAAGDYNTPPARAKESVLETLNLHNFKALHKEGKTSLNSSLSNSCKAFKRSC
jgi:hypothetical protein